MITMTRSLAVLSRLPATRTVQQYGPVVLGLAAAGAVSLLLRGYTYPRPLFLLALVLSIWGRGLGPGLVGAGLATVIVRFLFPELLPPYGLVSDTTVFGLTAVAISAFSSSKLRAEARRKGVEDQLRTSERRLTLAQSAAHLGVWERDLRTDTIAISGEYTTLYGLPPDRSQLTHQEWIRLVHPNDRERVEALIRGNRELQRDWDAEFRVVWPDGSVHWLLGKGSVFFDNSGQAVRRVGVNLDVTELKQAEEVRSHLAAIVESSDDAIIGKNLDGKIVSWNPGAERMYGYKAEEVVGRPISLLVPPELQDELPQILARLRHSGNLEHYETTRVQKDGSRIEVSATISPIRDSTGTVVGASTIARNVTKQKRVEAALRESEERFRNMADTAPVLIWVSGADKRCTFFNKPWLDFTGRTMDQEMGDGWTEGVHPDDIERCLATYTSSFDARCGFQMEYRLRRHDGEYCWLLDTGAPGYREGEFTGYIGSCIDVTEQKLMEERLRANEARLMDAQRLAKVGNWELDPKTDRLHWSDEMFRIFGVPNDVQPVFDTFLGHVHPKDREMIVKSRDTVVASATPIDLEFRIVRPDGNVRFVRSTVQAIKNDLGTPLRFVGATQDITEQISASQFLRESEERFRFAQKVANIGTFDWNIKTGVNTWTPELEAMYGLPQGGFGRTQLAWEALVHPEDRTRAVQRVKESFGTGTPVEDEWRVIRPDGSVRWLAGRWQVLKDASGEATRMMGVNIDITDRKQMEEALRRSEERFRLAIRATNDAIWDFDLKTGMVSWNEIYSTLYGRPAETSDSWQWWIDRIQPEDRERTVEGLHRAISSGASSWTSEYRFQRADGDWAYIYDRAYIARDGAGAAWRVIGAMQDFTERKHAEQALRDSEERFRVIFSQAAVGMAQTSLDGEWLLLNNRFCEMLGYTQAELRGKKFLEVTHPDDRDASHAAARRLLAGEISSWSTEKRYVRKDGAIAWVRLGVSLVRDRDNQPQYFIAVVEDVTERVKADRALRDSERRLMLAQSAAHMGTWERDLGTNVKAISGEYAKLYGLAPDHLALTYEEWLSLIHPEDREQLETRIKESIERTGSWDTEFRVVWPDGSVHWLLTKGTVVLDDSGQPLRRAGVNLDITERKQAEAALRESEQRFRNMADAAPVMIWVSGPDKGFTFFNKTWLDFTGRPLEQELGNGWAASVHPEDLDRSIAIFSSSFDARQDFQVECRLRRADGEYRWVLCMGVPRFEPGGAFAGYIGSDIDVTDQKHAEATVRRNLDEVAHLNRVAAMGELTASMAHEISQPLAAILSNAQAASRFLGGESPDLAQVRECLTDIVADDKRAGEVIKTVRTLLRRGESQASLVDLNEVVSDAIRLLGTDAMLRHASVKFQPLPAPRVVIGDRTQLWQVVLNLIVNGLEATAERPPVNRWVLVRTAEADGGGVELTVEDSGKGIAEGDLARVFEPFFTTKREGLGMGLSISHSIVQAHGGQIWAENSTVGGAIFHCMLPVAQQGAAASAK
jgi:PAS domain S-box-containing protein